MRTDCRLTLSSTPQDLLDYKKYSASAGEIEAGTLTVGDEKAASHPYVSKAGKGKVIESILKSTSMLCSYICIHIHEYFTNLQ